MSCKKVKSPSWSTASAHGAVLSANFVGHFTRARLNVHLFHAIPASWSHGLVRPVCFFAVLSKVGMKPPSAKGSAILNGTFSQQLQGCHLFNSETAKVGKNQQNNRNHAAKIQLSCLIRRIAHGTTTG